MNYLLFFSIFFTLLFGFVKLENLVVCYYGTWATYRNGNGKFETSDINPDLCTHLIYTFVGINAEGSIISLDPYLDYSENYGKDNFKKFTDLKNINPKLKTLLAVGGYNQGSAKYSTMAADPALRNNFITSAKEMVQKYNFDGLDVDWEYPAQRDSTNGAADKDNLNTLVKELKEEFAKDNLLVTIAVAAAEKSASLSYDIATLSQYVDFIHLMTYDLHGSWDPVTGHNAGLYRSQSELSLPAGQELTVEAAVKYWLQQGAPPDKLVVGVPFYGRTFTLSSADTGVGAPSSGPGSAGPYTGEAGFLGYNEICEKKNAEAWQINQDDLAKVPFAVHQNTWISYDDPTSLEAKVDFIRQNNLAGVMAWSIETDDARGLCGTGDFPLLRALNSALGNEGSSSTSTPATTVLTSTTTSTTADLTSTTTSTTNDLTSTTTSTTADLTSTTTSTTNDLTSTTTSATAGLTSTTTSATTGLTSTTISSSTPSATTSTANPNYICTTEGFAPNPQDCSSFFICLREADGSLTPFLIRCPPNLHWDQKILSCNYADQVSCSNIA